MRHQREREETDNSGEKDCISDLLIYNISWDLLAEDLVKDGGFCQILEISSQDGGPTTLFFPTLYAKIATGKEHRHFAGFRGQACLHTNIPECQQ